MLCVTSNCTNIRSMGVASLSVKPFCEKLLVTDRVRRPALKCLLITGCKSLAVLQARLRVVMRCMYMVVHQL